MFKVCAIIGISKIALFNFSGTERVNKKLNKLEFLFFIIYELNAVVSVHSNAFYSATSTLKMFYVNYFWARFVTICLLFKLFINVFLTNFLTFCDFRLLLYALFFSFYFLSTFFLSTKTDMKKGQK